MAITYRGEKFSGYNKPKRTPKHPTKSHAVLAKEGDKVKLIRFGQQGVSGAGKNPKSQKHSTLSVFEFLLQNPLLEHSLLVFVFIHLSGQ